MNQERLFQGFSKETFQFLKNLGQNNKKEWFEEHRTDYETYLLLPFKSLVSDLGEFMLLLDPQLEVKPVINKTISRIHRDTRFSKEKTPFKTNLWLSFKRRVPDWKITPVFFFELHPETYRLGMGFYQASPAHMVKIKNRIDDQPHDFMKAIEFMKKETPFTLEGENYKRFIANDHPEEIQPWYQKKSFYLSCFRENDALLSSSALTDEIMEGYNLLSRLYHFLWGAISRELG